MLLDMFSGFPIAAFEFYEDLEMNNSRAFWEANKHVYREAVQTPMKQLCDALADEFGAAKVFRPNRDVRFSSDKSPYKTHQGAYVPARPALGWYVQVSAEGLMLGGGFYQATPKALKRLRDRIVGPEGAELEALLAELESSGWTRGGDRVQTAPRGFQVTEPRIDLLRHKTLTVGKQLGDDPVVHTAELIGLVRQQWRQLNGVVEWLSEPLDELEVPS